MQRHKLQAQHAADILTAQFDADPHRTIYLTSHSGGGGIAIWALEDLPPRVKIQTLVMMSPAVSPRYDLSLALSHVNGRAYVFSSLDDPVLGLGCRMFGTIDGVKTDAAGRVGFVRPPGGDPKQYEKLVPIPYNPNWVYVDDYGDHVGGMNRVFARKMLVPLLLTGRMPEVQPPATRRSTAGVQ
jgi:pimeloyl-ACP methyl ester carboxylesterase